MAELGDSVQLFAQPRKKSSKRKLKAVEDVSAAPNSKQSKREKDPSTSSLQQQQQQQEASIELPERANNPTSTSDRQDVTFQDLGVSDWLCSVLASLGIKQPTQVQAGCIPAILAGRNVIGTAQTGSGKTAAFALPILQQLAKDPFGVFCLVLTPTR